MRGSALSLFVPCVSSCRGGWHTGLISRFSFNTIIEPDMMDDDDFVYGSYKDYDTLMAPYIDSLQAQQGKELSIKRADAHARRMRRETLQLAAEYTSEPLRVLCRRQSIIAQKRAYLYTLLEGGKWSQRLEDFLTWRYQYGLWPIFHTLGELIAAEQAAEEGALTKQLSNCRSRSLIADHPEQPGTYINHKKRPAA